MALPLTHGPAQPFTFADLDAIPDDGRRWELIAGSLVVSPAPFGAHLSGRGEYTERVTVIGDGRFTTDYPFPLSVTPAELAWRG